jgi:hypothetical protein
VPPSCPENIGGSALGTQPTGALCVTVSGPSTHSTWGATDSDTTAAWGTFLKTTSTHSSQERVSFLVSLARAQSGI